MSELKKILKELEISKAQLAFILTPYYLLTILNALVDGVGMVLLVNLFTGKGDGRASEGLVFYLESAVRHIWGGTDFKIMLPVLIVLFLLNFLMKFSLLSFDGYLGASLRRRLQEKVYEKIIYGDWLYTRKLKVGDVVGTSTQEATVVAKYMICFANSIYYSIGAIVGGVLALATSFQIAISIGMIALPLIILMKLVFNFQAKLSKEQAIQRNLFSSDITDRLNGLLQVHADSSHRYHFFKGLGSQSRQYDLEVKIGFCQGIVGSFNLLLPFFGLVSLFVMMFATEQSVLPDMSLVASVGILGLRVAGQLNGAISSFGQLSRLSGSLGLVNETLSIPQMRSKKEISEAIDSIRLNDVNFGYDGVDVVNSVSIRICKGSPLVLGGRSGKGKTTLVNIISGLFHPREGTVEYIGASKQIYSSLSHKPPIGFVTQDIYLFNETLRENLICGRPDIRDDQIWQVLELVGASDFIRDVGGLDSQGLEAGKSFSGGQKRRLGIARGLLLGRDLIILDEVFAGLDQDNKRLVWDIVKKISSTKLVVMISHESHEFGEVSNHRLEL